MTLSQVEQFLYHINLLLKSDLIVLGGYEVLKYVHSYFYIKCEK
jgi:hypothetical protein